VVLDSVPAVVTAIRYTKEDMLSYGRNLLINFEKKKEKYFKIILYPFSQNL
jgi:hypothetical protein